MRSVASAIALASLSVAGCDETDLTSIHVKLASDGSGAVTVVSVAVPDAPGAAEGASSGVTWTNRVSVNAQSGAFTDASALDIAGITFDRVVHGGMGSLEVVVPLGAGSPWVGPIAPLSEPQQRGLAQMLDPTGKTKLVGTSLKVVVELPGEVVSAGALPTGEGIAVSHKKNTATLIVPVTATVPYHDSVHWHVTWSQ